jgi:hypothetical protein
MPDRQRPRARPAWGKFTRRLRTAFGLVWSAWPAGVLAMVALAVLTGLAPASQAWLTRVLLNGLVPRLASPAHAATASGARSAGSMVTGLVPHLTTASAQHMGVLAGFVGLIGLIRGISPH